MNGIATSMNPISISDIFVSNLSITDYFNINTSEIIEDSLKRLNQEEQLKQNIGSALFDKLSKQDIDFILDLSGTINLGKRINIKNIYSLLEEQRDE